MAEFFNLDTARCVRETYGKAMAGIANKVLARVDDTIDLLRAGRYPLADGGMVIFEVNCSIASNTTQTTTSISAASP